MSRRGGGHWLMKAGLIVGLSLLGVSADAGDTCPFEDDRTAMNLYNALKIERAPTPEPVYCRKFAEGYMTAVVEGGTVYRFVDKRCPLDLSFYYPTGTTDGQVRMVFLKWAEDHPEELYKYAATAILMALSDTWPSLSGS